MASSACGSRPDHLADERLTELARAGDQAAFTAIVERYQAELQAHARRLVPDGRGDDVVQQAFLNAWSALTAGSEVAHLRGWLHTIVRNAATRTQRPIEAPLPDEVSGGEFLEELVQRRATVCAALSELSALPTRQRDALVSTALHGVPRAQVASRMGLSEGAVRQLVHRARLTVRRAVIAVLPYPLVRAFGFGAPDAVGPASDALVGAGAGSAGALMLKLGAVVAAGALATGVSVHEISHGPGDHRHAVHRRTTDVRAPGRLVHDPGGRSLAGGVAIPRSGSPAPVIGARLVTDDGRGQHGENGRGPDRERDREGHGDQGRGPTGSGDQGGGGGGAGNPRGGGDGGGAGDGGGGRDGGAGGPGPGEAGPVRQGPTEQNGGSPGGSDSSGGSGQGPSDSASGGSGQGPSESASGGGGQGPSDSASDGGGQGPSDSAGSSGSSG
jgi:RNA polymerase sigma factor (sigma-70 family)